MYKDVLPAEMFIPIQDRIIEETSKNALISIPKRAFAFRDLLTSMTGKLHQAGSSKLKVMQITQKMKCRLLEMRLLHFSFQTPCSKDEFILKNRAASMEVIKLLHDNIFDVEYEVTQIVTDKQHEIDRLNFELRKQVTHNAETFVAMAIPPEFMDDMKRFQ